MYMANIDFNIYGYGNNLHNLNYPEKIQGNMIKLIVKYTKIYK